MEKIPPRNEWNKMTSFQLMDVKSEMTSLYQNMRGANASFAPQYLQFIRELDALIQQKQISEQQEKDSEKESQD